MMWETGTKMVRIRHILAVLGLVIFPSAVFSQGYNDNNIVIGSSYANYAAKFHSIFDPRSFTRVITDETEGLLLICQLISALIIIGGLVTKMRKDDAQMEGIASMVLKVGFIATVPFWGALLKDTGELIADATGYATFPPYNQTANTATDISPVVKRVFWLAGEWTRDTSPQLEQINEAEEPTQGQEESWWRQAAHWVAGTVKWAKNAMSGLWNALSGICHSLVLFVLGFAMGAICIVMVVLTYFAEILRLALYFIGLAILPIFIAGLGVETMKNQSVRYILGMVGLALWPVAWALTNIITVFFIRVAADFIANILAAKALTDIFGTVSPTISMALPYLSWGVIILLVAVTIALFVWMLIGLIYGPYKMGQMIAQGSHMMGGLVAGAASTTAKMGAATTGVAATLMTGGAAAPLAKGMTAMAAGASNAVNRCASSAGSMSARGAAVIDKLCGQNMGAAAKSMSARFGSATSRIAKGFGKAARSSASAMGKSLEGTGGDVMRGVLKAASLGMAVAGEIDPASVHSVGKGVGQAMDQATRTDLLHIRGSAGGSPARSPVQLTDPAHLGIHSGTSVRASCASSPSSSSVSGARKSQQRPWEGAPRKKPRR